METQPKWKLFEKDIHAIHAMFASKDTNVIYDEHVTGFESQADRQIDVSIRAQVSNYPVFIVIECKDKARPIDVVEMGAFTSLVKDVRANKGIMISRSGYTKAAVELARSAGIDTLAFSSESISVPVELQTLTMTAIQTKVQWAVLCKHFGVSTVPLQPDHYMEVFSMQGERLGTMLDIVYEMGRRGAISTEMEESIWELPSPLLVKSEEHVHSVKLLVKFIVKKRYFIGTVAVEHVEIKNVQADKNVHDFVRTGFIFLKPWDQETKQWQEVPTLADLAITPAIHLVENPEWR